MSGICSQLRILCGSQSDPRSCRGWLAPGNGVYVHVRSGEILTVHTRFCICRSFTDAAIWPCALVCSTPRPRCRVLSEVRSKQMQTVMGWLTYVGLLARGLAEIGPRGGLEGWRWIMIIEGLLVCNHPPGSNITNTYRHLSAVSQATSAFRIAWKRPLS